MKKPIQNGSTSPARNAPGIEWDSSGMRITYANAISVTGDREEFSLTFGMKHSWSANQKKMKVQLKDRIVINPFSAKRLAKLLNDLVKDYESRYGAIPVGTTQPAPATNRKMEPKNLHAPEAINRKPRTHIDTAKL
jgi:hypothetical protein